MGVTRVFPISFDSPYDSVTYDVAKTKLSEFEAEAEEQTSENANSQGPCN